MKAPTTAFFMATWCKMEGTIKHQPMQCATAWIRSPTCNIVCQSSLHVASHLLSMSFDSLSDLPIASLSSHSAPFAFGVLHQVSMHVGMFLQTAATRTLCKHVCLFKIMAFGSRPTLSLLVWLMLVTSSLGAFETHVPVTLVSHTDSEQQHDTLCK